jgi:hypothetical protein
MFETKSKTLNMFQLHKKWKKYLIFFLMINYYGLNFFAYFNLYLICQHWFIARTLFIVFFVAFFAFLFLSCKALMATSHFC